MPTLAEQFDTIISLLVARTIVVRVRTSAVMHVDVVEREPDPAFAPLLAVVRETCFTYCVREHSRAAYWEQADNGALEGAWIKAVRSPDAKSEVHYSVLPLSDKLLGLLCEPGDTRLAATQAVLEWMKEIANEMPTLQ